MFHAPDSHQIRGRGILVLVTVPRDLLLGLAWRQIILRG
jgi:hypothetical protein